MGATWRVCTEDGVRVWDWCDGPAPVRDLLAVRRVGADAMSRHAPVRMACLTTGRELLLESGLEADLVRDLDRDRDVVWMVAQPVKLTFGEQGTHVPDLLVEYRDGRVVLWDARHDREQGDEFGRVAELTARACASVGWGYQVYGTPLVVRRLNLMWLATFRHAPGWPHRHLVDRLVERVGRYPAAVADLIGLDEGDGHLIAVLWHLLWCGRLVVGLDEPITAASLVRADGVVADA